MTVTLQAKSSSDDTYGMDYWRWEIESSNYDSSIIPRTDCNVKFRKRDNGAFVFLVDLFSYAINDNAHASWKFLKTYTDDSWRSAILSFSLSAPFYFASFWPDAERATEEPIHSILFLHFYPT